MHRAIPLLLVCAAVNGATLEGVVRDAQGRGTVATVEVRIGDRTLQATADSAGNYRFDSLAAGSYKVHASGAAGEANVPAFALSADETKKLDLKLDSAQFFDEPTFIVSGVTDPALRGGHGSDPVLRSAESLTKETAALRANNAPAASADSLRAAIGREPNRADLHHALADVEESQGDSLSAVREYQRAAELDPTEPYLFDWGVELLRHRAAEQAGEVFAKGHAAWPRSTRLLLGLGVALFSRNDFEGAAQRFFEAADLDPGDPTPYEFLGRLADSTIADLPGYSERLARFVRLHPDNAAANYYYAVCLRKQQQSEAQSLAERAVRLDPHFARAYLLLGAMLADQGNLRGAITNYRKAIDASPALAEAHYRLAQVLQRSGQAAQAHAEIETYRRLSRESAQAESIQEFVFSLRK